MIARLLISPNIKRRKEEIKAILASCLKCIDTNHPDLLYIKEGGKRGIAEARRIKEHFSLKPYSAKGRIAILENAEVLTIEAQNALLKTLEELPQDAILILGAGSETNLLPTILSRCQITRFQETNLAGFPHSTHGVKSEDIEKLLNSSIEERFEYIEKLKNKEEFLKALLRYFHQDLVRHKDFLAKLLQAEEWAKQNVNIRSILEYVVLFISCRI